MGVSIRRAAPSDRTTLVDILVEAFADDPFFCALWPATEAYRTAAREWFSTDVRQLEAHGRFWLTADGAGLACFVEGGAIAAPGEFEELQAIVDRTAGERAAGAMAILEAADTSAPAGPHWTCVYVAVVPAAQGRGLGRALMAPRLAAADRAAQPIHLASTNPRNLTFYERLGFRTIAVVQPDSALPPLWSMWREPQP